MAATMSTQQKKDVRVELQTSDNGGVIVSCSWVEDMKECGCEHGCSHPMGDYKRKQYVFSSLDEALKAIPGMISVKQDMDPKDAVDRKIMESEDY